MNRRLIFLTILIVALCIYVLVHLFSGNTPNANQTPQAGTPETVTELDFYKMFFFTNINNGNIQLENVMIKDSLGIEQPLLSVFGPEEEQILVCRFSELHCESCVDFTIQLLLRSKIIAEKNILFLGSYRNNKIFNREKKLYGIYNLKTYNTFSLNIALEELGYPYFFILDKDLTISNIIIPDKSLPSLSENFLELIDDRYFNSQDSKRSM